MDSIYIRGQIYYAQLGGREGSAQVGTRPVVIVSNDIGNAHSRVVMVVPITTKNKTDMPTHFQVQLTKVHGTVLCEQIMTLDKRYIGDYAGRLVGDYLLKLNKALRIALALDISELNQKEQVIKDQMQ